MAVATECRILFAPDAPKDSLVIEDVRAVDPIEGIDACLTVTVEDGIISRLEPAGSSRPELSRGTTATPIRQPGLEPGSRPEPRQAGGRSAARNGLPTGFGSSLTGLEGWY